MFLIFFPVSWSRWPVFLVNSPNLDIHSQNNGLLSVLFSSWCSLIRQKTPNIDNTNCNNLLVSFYFLRYGLLHSVSPWSHCVVRDWHGLLESPVSGSQGLRSQRYATMLWLTTLRVCLEYCVAICKLFTKNGWHPPPSVRCPSLLILCAEPKRAQVLLCPWQ